MAHTPGPWNVIRSSEATFIGPVSQPNQTFMTLVCEIGNLELMEERAAEGTANAHLIAAAPDLLKTMREFIGALEATKFDVFIGSPSELDRLRTAADNARCAIAKAEGKTDQ